MGNLGLPFTTIVAERLRAAARKTPIDHLHNKVIKLNILLSSFRAHHVGYELLLLCQFLTTLTPQLAHLIHCLRHNHLLDEQAIADAHAQYRLVGFNRDIHRRYVRLWFRFVGYDGFEYHTRAPS